jgi:hypothetical protein
MRKLLLKGAGLSVFLAGSIILIGAVWGLAKPAPADGGFVVHEWGTFLSVEGSDGVTLGGMVDSEEELPHFVQERDLDGRSRATMLSKMETPVTYFYTDRPRRVSVRVAMPKGLLTHWFPHARAFGPPKGEKPAAPEAGSFLDWGQFDVIPDTRAVKGNGASGPQSRGDLQLFQVAGDSTWRFARETDAALVKFRSAGRDRYEKFLFYRGLGSFELPLEVRSAGADDRLRLTLRNRGEQPMRGLFLIWVDKATLRFAALDDLSSGTVREVDAAPVLGNRMLLNEGVPRVKEAVAAALVKEGLYPKEAQAMVNTWEKSYFRTEGLRILSVLPRPAVDAAIPIKIEPAPDELVRVMVGRVEVLTPDMERRVEEQVAKLDAKDPKVQEAAVTELDRLGRLKEPVLRRILATAKTAEVRAQAEKVIARAASK